ncbi:hypothetical protein ACE38V_07960 [Cytobacillus sp. Hz8]|uniref:hypothetical protein n=1 Tax=Cytobacillus sp. Hz8 TaxID=3347168 RepID=UPI0035D98309
MSVHIYGKLEIIEERKVIIDSLDCLVNKKALIVHTTKRCRLQFYRRDDERISNL